MASFCDALAGMAEGGYWQRVPEGTTPGHSMYSIRDGKLMYQGDPTGPRPDTNPSQQAEPDLATMMATDWVEVTQATKDFYGIKDAEPPLESPAATRAGYTPAPRL